MTMTGTVLGTAGYLSPEQAKGERATPASDRYALGVVAYELMTGERPFASDSATAEAAAHVHAPIPYASQHGDIPPELDPVLRRALAKDPAERYPSSADFVAELREALSHAAGATRALAPATPPPRRVHPLVWAAAAILGLLALGAGLGMAGVLGDEDEPQTRTVVETKMTTLEGQPTTVRETVTTAPATTSATTTATTAAPSDASGEELTDQATALLNQGRWAEAEGAARQALTKLEGSGELYEGYASYDLGRALVEQGRCDEALLYLDRSEQIQGNRKEIRQARKRCS
jgi:tetratricopeptide (TPR) repeat protein